MRALLIALMVVLLAAPALAQKKTDEEKKAEAAQKAAEDQAYRLSADRIPAGSAVDPWAGVRGAEQPQSKPGKPKKPSSSK